jgi:hypothetical protein
MCLYQDTFQIGTFRGVLMNAVVRREKYGSRESPESRESLVNRAETVTTPAIVIEIVNQERAVARFARPENTAIRETTGQTASSGTIATKSRKNEERRPTVHGTVPDRNSYLLGIPKLTTAAIAEAPGILPATVHVEPPWSLPRTHRQPPLPNTHRHRQLQNLHYIHRA